MFFKDRCDAGRQLCHLLGEYKNMDVVVYALPRGGVVVAEEIAQFLHAPLGLVLSHKIGHPRQPEYAIAAVSESGHVVGNAAELQMVDKAWFSAQKEREMNEIRRKREIYLKGRQEVSARDKIALIVDDGIATGLTMQAGIKELRERHPRKIVAVVPVAPRGTADLLETMADELVAVAIPSDRQFLGSVGAYFADFQQVEDETVMDILERHK